MKSNFIVYKASAGSGKTFTLATQYISRVVQNPYDFRHILAVTFTNKATEEMKIRILSQLYGIWKGLDDSHDYQEQVKELTGIQDVELIRRNAGLALNNLIHDYNYFQVETIDTFFQSIFRNLAHELSLVANLRVGLNDAQVKDQAVERLIENLNEPGNEKVKEWVIEYIHTNMDEDKNWKVVDKIKEFGKQIFNDNYKLYRHTWAELAQDNNFYQDFRQRLLAMKRSALAKITDKKKAFLAETDEEELSAFSNGNDIVGYLNRLETDKMSDMPSNRLQAKIDSSDNWVKKSMKGTDRDRMLAKAVVLQPLLSNLETTRRQEASTCKTVDVTLRNINQLRLLNNIETLMMSINAENHRFLLSDTQLMLNGMIGDDDSPFIYEKIGARINHVMFDEFQDTSTIQWNNFKLLMKECLSKGSSLVVGDVKQSIYRWRSGDWRLLNNIQQEFQQADIQHLDTNFRSQRNIIEFNNKFFETAAVHEQAAITNEMDNAKFTHTDQHIDVSQITKAYIDLDKEGDIIEQKAHKAEHKGLVSIHLFGKSDDPQGRILQELEERVTTLHAEGIDYHDMAILVRVNDEATLIADYFMREQPDIKLVSDEAFRLDSSLAVNVIVDALHLLTHPKDMLAKARLAKAFVLIKTDQEYLETATVQEDILLPKGPASDSRFNELLPQEYVVNQTALRQMPIFDAAQAIYRFFQLNKLKEQSSYVCCFFDKLSAFLQDSIADIDAFIDEWNDNLYKKTIQSDEVDGIRLITIHKSKGLEFNTLFIPFCDWKLERASGYTLWCDARKSYFAKPPIIPIHFDKKGLLNSAYEPDYWEEHLQNYVDNLNLLYVAFTRAANNLYITGQRNGTGCRSHLIEDCLEEVKSKLEDQPSIKTEDDDITFEYGTPCIENKKKEHLSSNVFLKEIIPHNIEVNAFDKTIDFRQSNKSKDFVAGIDDNSEHNTYIQYGNVIHCILSMVKTMDDLDKAIAQMEADGMLDNDRLEPHELKTILTHALSDPKIHPWFDAKWRVINECTILSVDPNNGTLVNHRPDRVITDGHETLVIDYKTGSVTPEHRRQVWQYVNLLQQMGYPNVQGFLWYLQYNKVEKVTPA